MGEQKIEEKEAVKKKYSVPSYERRDTFAIWTERRNSLSQPESQPEW